jgi:hypothetical protein
MKLDTKQKPLDIVKYVFEALFIVVYIYMIIRFVLSIKENIAEYKKWYRDVIYYQNLKVKYNRNRIEPEFLRKFRSILSLSTCIEFIIILMTIGIIYTKALLWYKENELYDVLVTPDTAKVFGDDYNTPDGSCIRDYIYVVDLAKAHVKAVDRMISCQAEEQVEVFNLGTGRGLSVLEILRTFIQVTGVNVPYEIVGRREGDIEQVWAKPDKANTVLGWSADTPIEEVLLSAWKWEQKIRSLD